MHPRSGTSYSNLRVYWFPCTVLVFSHYAQRFVDLQNHSLLRRACPLESIHLDSFLDVSDPLIDCGFFVYPHPYPDFLDFLSFRFSPDWDNPSPPGVISFLCRAEQPSKQRASELRIYRLDPASWPYGRFYTDSPFVFRFRWPVLPDHVTHRIAEFVVHPICFLNPCSCFAASPSRDWHPIRKPSWSAAGCSVPRLRRVHVLIYPLFDVFPLRPEFLDHQV